MSTRSNGFVNHLKRCLKDDLDDVEEIKRSMCVKQINREGIKDYIKVISLQYTVSLVKRPSVKKSNEIDSSCRLGSKELYQCYFKMNQKKSCPFIAMFDICKGKIFVRSSLHLRHNHVIDLSYFGIQKN